MKLDSRYFLVILLGSWSNVVDIDEIQAMSIAHQNITGMEPQ